MDIGRDPDSTTTNHHTMTLNEAFIDKSDLAYVALSAMEEWLANRGKQLADDSDAALFDVLSDQLARTTVSDKK